MTVKRSKRERRAARYKLRAFDLRTGICASMIWAYRWRLAARYGYGPRSLRGKSRYQLFEMLYCHGED